VAGFRLVSHSGSDEQSTSSTRFIVLVEAESSLPLAIVDEGWSYAQRTVASVVMASKHLANDGASTLALIGAGRLATSALEYYSRLFRLGEVRVVSRRPETRGRLAERASEQYGLRATPTDSAEQAARGADLVLTCTNSGRALLEEPWIGPGAVVAALDSSEPGPELAEQADLFVVDSREQLQKELVEQFGPEAPSWVDATVGEVVSKQHPGRTSAAQRVLIITEGMASQDIALAYLAYQRAVERQVGTPLPR
jgi:ornithine cyclodeaminase/alanine dehydrogenase-like protein (mu-crystallin family)